MLREDAGGVYPEYSKGPVRSMSEEVLAGDVATTKTILRDYINATLGFADLAKATRIPSKSLMRRLAPAGNPRADNLFEIVSFLQRREGVCLEIKTARA